MSQSLLDLDRLATNSEPIIGPGKSVNYRRARALSHLAKATFHPLPLIDSLRGKEKLIPKDYQLLPLEAFNAPWLSSLELEDKNAKFLPRDTLIVGDEGGMGKTYSSVLVAHRYLSLNPSGTVVVLCPPLLATQWKKEFERLHYRPILRSSHKLTSGDLPVGDVIIVSKFSPMRNPLTDELSKQVLRDRVELCILDEGHEGMIAAGADIDAEMRKGMRRILLNCKRRLVLTATPIRKDSNGTGSDLKALISSCIEDDDHDNFLLNQFDFSGDWLTKPRSEWLPSLEKLYEGNLDDSSIKILVERCGEMIPFLGNNAELVSKSLKDKLPEINSNPIKRMRLARDLIPLGKYLSISVRDDLGRAVVESSFREETVETHGFEFSDEFHQAKLKIQNFGKARWESCIFSCPLNAINPRYEKTFPDLIGHSSISEENLLTLWEDDPRLEQLIKIDDEMRYERAYIGEKIGIVIFCEWSGTVDRLEEWAINSEQFNVFKLRGLDSSSDDNYLNQSDGSNQQYEHRIKQQKILSKLDKTSIHDDESKTNLLICGPGVTVGHNMQWANTVVHWDINFGSVENIAQKTWRLDRIFDKDSQVSKEYHVHYFVNRKDVAKIADANKSHQKNRLFLGDRRYHDYSSSEYPILIPEPGEKFVRGDSWSNNPKEVAFFDLEMEQFWKFIEGGKKTISGTSEVLGLQFLCEVTGININLENQDEIEFEEIGEDSVFGGIYTTFYNLITLAGVSERGSLQFLKGGYSNAKTVMSRFGPPMEGSSPLLNILPNGVLITKLSKILRTTELENDDYAFTMILDEKDEGKFTSFEHILRFGVHLGLIEIREDVDRWNLFKKFHGANCPSGLIIRKDTDDWRHVTISELNSMNQNEFEEIVKIISEFTKFDCSAEIIPEYDIVDDYNKYEKLRALNPLLNPLNKENFDGDNEWLSAMSRIGGNITKMMENQIEPENNQFLPVAVVSKSGVARVSCPACNAGIDCSSDECSWQINGTIGWS